MTVAANLVNDASCTWTMGFEDGAFVEVRRSLGPGGTFTILQVNIGDLRVGVQVIDETTAILEMFDTILPAETVVQLPYDSQQMRWWRLRPESGQVIGEYSRDGKAWTRRLDLAGAGRDHAGLAQRGRLHRDRESVSRRAR